MCEAESKYNQYKSLDPFPGDAPALLNSADIIDYVAATGMLFPFYPDKDNLKASSYRISLLGKFVYWDREGERHWGSIDRGQKFFVEPNSIAFLTVEPFIRLPAYIAARFNLTVNHVYRGLLLGTGPMIDPGFVGRLSIPLHNFTTNTYTFEGGEHLISMEFTKVSPNAAWTDMLNNQERQGVYQQYPSSEKKSWEVDDYLLDADRHRPIISSIPKAIHDAGEAAKKAEKWTKIISISGLGLGIAIVVAVGTTIYNAYNLHGQAVMIARNAQETVQAYKEPKDSLMSLAKGVEEARFDARNLTVMYQEQKDSLVSLAKRVAALTEEVKKLKTKPPH
jgi:deoxycytidine triphosphate deaminase